VNLFLLTGCQQFKGDNASATNALPSITAQPTGEYHTGKVVWHDLLTPNPDAARKFYGQLFGWSFEPTASRYTEIKHNGKKIGGIIRIDSKKTRQAAAQWLISISVPDIKQAKKQVKAAGGMIVNGPNELGKRGQTILVGDAQNAQFLLLKSPSGDPTDQEPQIGEWLWNEVWTLDRKREQAFYKLLGQYNDLQQNQEYAILQNEGRWRIGIRQIKQKEFAGRWLPVVRVENPAALLDRVEKLGGRVWTRPNSSQQTALISDSDGAFLILQSWDFTDKKKEEL
jgi:predicted enzyme related to lactoylglutathione lyase